MIVDQYGSRVSFDSRLMAVDHIGQEVVASDYYLESKKAPYMEKAVRL